MRRTYTTQVRVLLCQSCGAPLEIASDGTMARCAYCHVDNQVRRSSRKIAPPSQPIDEHERMRRLRMQDGKPLVPPPSLMPLLHMGGIHPAKVDETFHVYQATRREVETTSSPDAAERLYFLTLMLNTHLAGDEPRRRALLETTLETVSLPRHIQVVRALLASASAKEGDIASADEWLSGCNPSSDDLDADSAFRVAHAFVDTAKGDFGMVIRLLGEYDDAYPIADAWDPTAAVLRANALERLGNLDAAVNALRTRMQKEGQGGRAIMEKIIQMHPQMHLCTSSYAAAKSGHAQIAAKSASAGAGGMIGTIFFVTGIGVILLGVLIGGIIMLATAGPALAMGGDMGMGMGESLLSGGLTCGITAMTGVPFMLLGWGFRKKGQQAAWLRVHGISAQGTVRGYQPTGTTINDVPLVRVEVMVTHPQTQAYVASFNQLLSPQLAAHLTPGNVVPLRVHPQKPNEILLETS